MHPKFRSITSRIFERAMKKDGFILIHQKGSHKSYVKGDKLVTVASHHSGDTFPPKTLRRMIVQAGWSQEHLLQLI